MKRLLKSFFLVLVLVMPALASAATFYVRAGATGRADGSDWANAYTSLPSTLARGSDYYIAGGNYPAYTFNTPASGTTVISVKKATVANHGTSTGWSDSYGTQAQFPSFRFTTSHWVVDGQTGGGPGSWTSGFGFRINQTSNNGVLINPQSGSVSNITVRHFEVIGTRKAQAGADAFSIPHLGTATLSNVTVSHFYFDQISRCPFFLAPGTSANGILIEYGYTGVYGDLTNTVHSEIASMWAGIGNVTFRYNIFTYVYSTGGLMWGDADGLYVYGNVFYKRANSATWDYPNGIIGTWTAFTATNVKVYNNTFVDITAPSGSGNVFGSLYTSPTTGNEIRNNLFVNVSRPMGGGALFPTQTHNHFIGTTAFGTYSTTGSGDPFVDKANLDFRLTTATPAGTALASPYAADAWGIARGSDGTIDRGAYEFNGKAAVVPPPTGLTVR